MTLRPWGTATATSYVTYMVRCLHIWESSRPWTTNHLAHSSPSYWIWNWIQLLCLNGKGIARILERFLITQPCRNSWTFEHALLRTQCETNRRRQTARVEKTSTKLSYHVNIANTSVACKASKDPLYTLSMFRSLPRGQMMAILNDHGHCIKCLKPGHFVKPYPCAQKCRKCQKPHHTWLHIDKEARKQAKWLSPLNGTSGTVTHHSDLNGRHQVVLTTCQVQIVSPESSTIKARALLDSASSTSFITDSLAQRLHLQRCVEVYTWIKKYESAFYQR